MLAALQALLPLRNRRTSQLGAMLDRGLIKLAKAVTQIQETHPWSVLTLHPSHTFCLPNDAFLQVYNFLIIRCS